MAQPWEMILSSSPNNPHPTTPISQPTIWQWVTLSFGLVGAMAFAMAHAPPGWQRPGPTAFWFAVVSGVVVGGIAVVNCVRSRRLVFLVAFLVISAAIAGMTAERYRIYDKWLRDLYLGPPGSHNPAVMSETLKHGQVMEELMKDIHEQRRLIYEARRPFPVFLKFRLEALGISTEPWPLVFWLGEILLGGLVGAFVALRWQTWQFEAQQTSTNAG